MGNNCKHLRTEVVETLNEDKNILFTNKIVISKCLDCLTDGKPTLIRNEVKQGNLTGYTYANNSIDKKNCKHEKFTVDPSTYEYYEEDTLGGTLMAMFTARWIHPKNHYIAAIGCCDRCDLRFYVKCLYTTENKWENYQQQQKQKCSDWTIVYKTVDG